MDILLIEDNQTITKGLTYTFSTTNYNLVSASNIEEAKQILTTKIPKLILLDVTLPDGNGFDLYEEKIKILNIPTIFLTAKDTEDDIVKGLELGAADYITKPFSTRELLARINRILSSKQSTIKVKNITFNFDKMEVFKNDEIINLTSLETKILYLLFTNINKVVKREYLIEYIWNLTGNDINDNTITVYLKRIREKLGCDIIKTIKGIGYRIDEEYQ